VPVAPTQPDFAAADVHRPPAVVPMTLVLPGSTRLLGPAALVLIALVAASGSFLVLAYCVYGRGARTAS
jgi:hypothetical protein